MTGNTLVPYQEMNLSDTMRLGETLAKSGYFKDAKDAAQAVVKVLAGRELGFAPIASMTGINVIKGKVSLGANLMASLVKSDPRYDYCVVELTSTRCELMFSERGQEVGRSIFTIDEARAAGVGSAQPPGKPSTMLTMFPRNMLFSRAMSNGLRWYCPDASAGNALYTPDEMGATVDGEGAIIEMPTPTVTVPATAPTYTAADDLNDKMAYYNAPAKPNGIHWIDQMSESGKPIRARFWAWAKTDRALTEEQIYTALNVEQIHDYPGTMGEAKADIDDWIAGQAKLAEDIDELYPTTATDPEVA